MMKAMCLALPGLCTEYNKKTSKKKYSKIKTNEKSGLDIGVGVVEEAITLWSFRGEVEQGLSANANTITPCRKFSLRVLGPIEQWYCLNIYFLFNFVQSNSIHTYWYFQEKNLSFFSYYITGYSSCLPY